MVAAGYTWLLPVITGKTWAFEKFDTIYCLKLSSLIAELT